MLNPFEWKPKKEQRMNPVEDRQLANGESDSAVGGTGKQRKKFIPPHKTGETQYDRLVEEADLEQERAEAEEDRGEELDREVVKEEARAMRDWEDEKEDRLVYGRSDGKRGAKPERPKGGERINEHLQ